MRDKDATELFNGVPVIEAALTMQVGDCILCGEGAAEKGRGLIKNPQVRDGVMTGEVVCIDCVLADPELSEHLDDLED